MARWRLMTPHYLFTNPPTEWEQKETDRETGEERRVRYVVPKLLDTNDPKLYNSPDGIIISDGKGQKERRDYVFLGDPTPDMEPVDEEAEKISASFRARWQHPIDSLPGQMGEDLIRSLEAKMSQLLLAGQAQPPQPVSAGAVSATDFKALQEQVAQLMARNAELESRPQGAATGGGAVRRRA